MHECMHACMVPGWEIRSKGSRGAVVVVVVVVVVVFPTTARSDGIESDRRRNEIQFVFWWYPHFVYDHFELVLRIVAYKREKSYERKTRRRG